MFVFGIFFSSRLSCECVRSAFGYIVYSVPRVFILSTFRANTSAQYSCESVYGFPTETAINSERDFSLWHRSAFSAPFVSSSASLLFKLPKKYMRSENMMRRRRLQQQQQQQQRETNKTENKIIKENSERTVEVSPLLCMCVCMAFFL